MSGDDEKPKAGAGTKLVVVPQEKSTKPSAVLTALTSMLKPPKPANVVKAVGGSVGVGGDNTGTVINAGGDVVINQQLSLSLQPEHQIARELPSALSLVVSRLSEESLAEYDQGPHRPIPPEVDVKIAYNNLPPRHHVVEYYNRYGLILEASYKGVEQRNFDARRLVRYRAAVTYQAQLQALCQVKGVAPGGEHECARSNAATLVTGVIDVLLAEFKADGGGQVRHEIAHLAVGLVVADAIIECEVLERPVDAVAS